MADAIQPPRLDPSLTQQLIDKIKARRPVAEITMWFNANFTQDQKSQLSMLIQNETSNEFPDFLSMLSSLFIQVGQDNKHIQNLLESKRPERGDMADPRPRTYGDWLAYILETASVMSGQGKRCRKCGLSKLRGAGGPSRNTFYKLVLESYKPSAQNQVDGWTLVAESPTIKIYRKDTDVVVSIRGTFDSEDAKADSLIATNNLESSSRFKKDFKFLDDFIKADNSYPPSTYYGVGHSLGGAILDLFLNNGMIKEGQSYNPAIQPQDFNRELPNHRIFMSGDPLYTAAKSFLKQKPEVIQEKASLLRRFARFTPIGNLLTAPQYLKSHGLDNFEGKGR